MKVLEAVRTFQPHGVVNFFILRLTRSVMSTKHLKSSRSVKFP